jgi:hypothetical protein
MEAFVQTSQEEMFQTILGLIAAHVAVGLAVDESAVFPSNLLAKVVKVVAAAVPVGPEVHSQTHLQHSLPHILVHSAAAVPRQLEQPPLPISPSNYSYCSPVFPESTSSSLPQP